MKLRLDVYMVQSGLSPGREKAKALIMAGQVYVNGQKAERPAAEIDESAQVEIRGNDLRYVSRGGLKLEKALQVFPIRLEGLTCMDVGASTGGFTDCMLQNGADRVYAVDVGYGQLAWPLRNDPRVTVMERTNIRYLTSQDLPVPMDFVGIDVSFISLSLVLPAVWPLMRPDARLVCLIKPQFEAGKGKVGKKGVVREASIHLEVAEKVFSIAAESGFCALGIDYSPVKGPQGNIEYLLFLEKSSRDHAIGPPDLERAVRRSHEEL